MCSHLQGFAIFTWLAARVTSLDVARSRTSSNFSNCAHTHMAKRINMDSPDILDTSRGWSHLHDLCSGISHPADKHWESLLTHIDRFAEEAAEKDKFGHTPLHLLLRHNPPLAVVDALYEAYKDALCQAEDKTGYLPLHVACLMGCNVDVVR